MATRQYITNVENAATTLGKAVQKVLEDLKKVVPTEPIGSIRDDCAAADQALRDLDAHIRILEQHLKGKPKLVRLLKDKYRNAQRFLDDKKDLMGALSTNLAFVQDQVRQIWWV
jgi:hypothetical protein